MIANPLPSILLVDDKQENLVAMEQVLKSLNAKLVFASSGNDALSKVLRHDFALILMDVRMPEMDGFETASLLREYLPTKRTPIIFVTAVGQEEVSLFRGYETGAVDFLFKPIDAALLKWKVHAFLELHRQKQALMASEGRTRALLEAMPDLILRVDGDCVVIDGKMPETWKAMLLPHASLAGQRLCDLIPDKLAKVAIEATQRAIETGEIQVSESREHLEEGVWVFEVRAVRSAEQEVVMLVRDVSERSRAEAEARAVHQARSLEKMYRELEAAHAELQQNQLMLIQTEKLAALGELSAGVSHEMKQPLNVIKIICQSSIRDLRKQRLEEKELERNLNEVVLQVRKLTEIIDHMRVYARPSVSAPKQKVNINEIIEGVLRWTGHELAHREIEVVTQLAADLPEVSGEPVRLEQVLMNLLANARDALDHSQDSKKIEIASAAIRSEGSGGCDEVVLEVRDNGVGIPQELQGRVFESFFTTKDKDKGTGLGLYVTSKIVVEHEGRIEFDSRVGEGTSFRVYLPVSTIGEEK